MRVAQSMSVVPALYVPTFNASIASSNSLHRVLFFSAFNHYHTTFFSVLLLLLLLFELQLMQLLKIRSNFYSCLFVRNFLLFYFSRFSFLLIVFIRLRVVSY